MYSYVASRPVADPTPSFWLSQPDPIISDYQSSQFVDKVDVAIIGGGLTGAFVSYNLLSAESSKKPESVAIFEARTAASGASGRNGGHIKPDCYRGFSLYSLLHGEDAAKAQCTFEAANHRATIEFIRENGLEHEIDHVEYRSADIYMSQKAWETGLNSFNGFKSIGGDVSNIRVLESDEAEKSLRVKGCYGAITFPASSLWPYKLAIRMLRKSIDLGAFLYTHTPVTEVSPTLEGKCWKLKTERGDVLAKRVIHATNGYASHLLPELAGRIIPLKGHVSAIVPPESYDTQPLSTSFGIIMDEDFDYLIQRPGPTKHLIWGGGDIAHPKGVNAGYGDCDDSTVAPEILSYLRDCPGRIFHGWDESNEIQHADTQCDYEWSGVMGMSKDALPFLGEVPGKPGQYLAAAYHGHGMARVFLAAKGFAQYFLGEPIDERIPALYFDLGSRLKEPIDARIADQIF